MKSGTLFWVTGLAGSGKTTIGKLLTTQLDIPAIHLDGDKLRQLFQSERGYSREDRLWYGERYSALAHYFCEQGISVVLTTITMFDDLRRNNRNKFESYFEVYCKCPEEIRQQRKPIVNGVNFDQYEEPMYSDVTVNTDGSKTAQQCVDYILGVYDVWNKG